jgi:hypothetical protein
MAMETKKGMMAPQIFDEANPLGGEADPNEDVAKFGIPKGAKKVFAELAKIGLSLAATSGSTGEQLGALQTIQDQYADDADRQNAMLKTARAANKAEGLRRIKKLNNLKETRKNMEKFGYTVLSDSGIKSAVDKALVAGVEIDINDPKLATYLGRIYSNQRNINIPHATITASIINQIYTSTKTGKEPFPDYKELPYYKENKSDKQMRELNLDNSNKLDTFFTSFAKSIDPKEQAEYEREKMEAALPPEVSKTSISTDKGITMVPFATGSQQRSLLKNANVLAAGENKVEPVYSPTGDRVTGFTGGNNSGIRVAKDIMQLLPFMVDAQYGPKDSSKLYNDSKGIVTYAINQAKKMPGYRETPETTFNDVLIDIKNDLTKLTSPEKVEYIKNLITNKGEDSKIKTKGDTLEDKLGLKTSGEFKELINSGAAKQTGPTTFEVLGPDGKEVIEVEYVREKIIEWSVKGEVKPGGLGLLGGVGETGDSPEVTALINSGLTGQELQKALDLEARAKALFKKKKEAGAEALFKKKYANQDK